MYLVPFSSLPIGTTFIYLRIPTKQSRLAGLKLLPIFCKKVEKSKARPMSRYVKADVPKWHGDEGDARYRGLPDHVFDVRPEALVVPIQEKLSASDLVLLPRGEPPKPWNPRLA